MKMTNIINFSIIMLVMCLTSCMTTKLNVYGELDSKEKSITMPAGNNAIIQPIKEHFKKEGWKVLVGRGADITEGVIGKDRKIKSYGTYNSRYTLYASYIQYDWCLNLDSALNYNISMVDNKTMEEIVVMSGRGCESSIAEKFIKALTGKQN